MIAAGLVLAVIGLGFGYFAMQLARGIVRKRRWVAEAERARSIALDGLVASELVVVGGAIEDGPVLADPIEGRPAVWYRVSIEVERRRDGRLRLEEVDPRVQRGTRVVLRDESGRVEVELDGRDVLGPLPRSEHVGTIEELPAAAQQHLATHGVDARSVLRDPRCRLTVERLEPGAALTVIGRASRVDASTGLREGARPPFVLATPELVSTAPPSEALEPYRKGPLLVGMAVGASVIALGSLAAGLALLASEL
jgi:hypothetical protein